MFNKQFANVVEWEEFRDDQIFFKWDNNEIKKGSKLIIRPGQNAIFTFNGKIEGVFENAGSFDIESQIVPFLSTLKGFKFGFNSGMRAEVIFINTKQLTLKWGTKNPINIPTPQMPGGLPIRANGTLVFKVSNYVKMIQNIAGVKTLYTVNDIKIRITSVLDQLLMKWISKEGKDLFNLQANADEIGNGIKSDLDLELDDVGLTVTQFNITGVSYPEEIQNMVQKNAAYSMVGDMNRYSQMQMLEGMTQPGNGNNMGAQAMQMMFGMNMANQMMPNLSQPAPTASAPSAAPQFCPNCGCPVHNEGAKFCSKCGSKLV